MKSAPAWCPGGRVTAKAQRAPPARSAAALAAPSAAAFAAAQVPATNGVPLSIE